MADVGNNFSLLIHKQEMSMLRGIDKAKHLPVSSVFHKDARFVIVHEDSLEKSAQLNSSVTS